MGTMVTHKSQLDVLHSTAPPASAVL